MKIVEEVLPKWHLSNMHRVTFQLSEEWYGLLRAMVRYGYWNPTWPGREPDPVTVSAIIRAALEYMLEDYAEGIDTYLSQFSDHDKFLASFKED